MIITEEFNGIYLGKDPEKDFVAYMRSLKDFCGEDIIKRNKTKFPYSKRSKDWNMDLKSEEFKALPLSIQKEIKDFWYGPKGEVQKMRKGVGSISPGAYGYVNYCKLRGGKGPTQFRRSDNDMFWLQDACINGDNREYKGYKNKGVIQVGRRRDGKTSRVMWTNLQVISNTSNVDIVSRPRLRMMPVEY